MFEFRPDLRYDGDRRNARAVLNELMEQEPGKSAATKTLGELEAR
jgi:hypothetical protein